MSNKPKSSHRMNRFHQTLIVVSVMLLTSVCIRYFGNPGETPIKKSLSNFPIKIGDWRGKVDRFDENVYAILGVDDSILINFHNKKNQVVQLYIGYYKSQRKGNLIHSPKNCMPGSGWDIVETDKITISRGDDIRGTKNTEINKLKLKNGMDSQIALYWFYSRGRVISSEYYQKFYLAWDAITKGRTDGSFIRVISPVSDAGESQITKDLKDFVDLIFPILHDFIPT